MKSGQYSMRFGCDGYDGTGLLSLDGVLVRGGDPACHLVGQITETGRNVTGALTIDLAPGTSGNARINGRFACLMTGSSSDDSFSLYGTGPLGLIIEINCQWAGPITERRLDTDRRQLDRGSDRRGRTQ